MEFYFEFRSICFRRCSNSWWNETSPSSSLSSYNLKCVHKIIRVFSCVSFIPLLALIDSIVIISCRNRCQSDEDLARAKCATNQHNEQCTRLLTRMTDQHHTIDYDVFGYTLYYTEWFGKYEMLSRSFLSSLFILLFLKRPSSSIQLSPVSFTFYAKKRFEFFTSSPFKWRARCFYLETWQCDQRQGTVFVLTKIWIISFENQTHKNQRFLRSWQPWRMKGTNYTKTTYK